MTRALYGLRRKRARGRFVAVIGALALATWTSACGPGERTQKGEPEVTPRPAVPAPTRPEPTSSAEIPTPDSPQAEPPRITGAGLAGDPARGEELYRGYCASCHGPRGEADGPVAAGLNPKPARHSDGGYMNALSNEHLFRVIKEGGAAVGKSPLMTAWGGALDDSQIWDLVTFVRTLADPPYQPGS